MSEIKCPNCGKTFKIDENSYAEIVRQVRDSEFSSDIEKKIHDATEVLHAKSAYNKAWTTATKSTGLQSF